MTADLQAPGDDLRAAAPVLPEPPALPVLPVVTVVQSSPDVGLERFADWLDGVEVRVVRADLGADVPSLDAVGDGLLVLGGQMDAYADERAPWLPALRHLLAAASGAGVPTLGICLGAQLLAVARGGRVHVAAPPGREAGIVPVRWRPEAVDDALVGPLVALGGSARVTPQPAMHADAVIDLPRDAVWLASSTMYPYQAFRVGSAWGVQFHPEVGRTTFGGWAEHDPDVDTAAVLDAFDAHDEALQVGGRTLARSFAALVRTRVTA